MLLPDVNVLVYAARREAPDHERYRQWLHDVVNGTASFGMSELVLSGFVRIVSNPRIFRTPTPVDQALSFTETVLGRANCVRIAPGARHYAIFAGLSREIDLRGADVTDAYLAALAIESGCTWITADRGFGRFPRLTWRTPLG